ncbi:MAG: hypothetical protein EOO09_01525 [Chitinophagaceae bacterium]|nr:MAG: hypothetical protein EOO09_01525 [Chitinophagaceae bacterium]
MKKLAAISLICLLAFNWFGYRIVTGVMSDDADQRLEAQLDTEQYEDSQLIEVRIPLNVPYQVSQAEFERHYGEVEADGIIYTYVKSKVEMNELVLKCIPNDAKKQIREAGNDFYKKTNGLDQDQSGKKTNNQVVKQSATDYDDRLETFTVQVPVESVSTAFARFSSALTDAGLVVAGQPPQFFI